METLDSGNAGHAVAAFRHEISVTLTHSIHNCIVVMCQCPFTPWVGGHGGIVVAYCRPGWPFVSYWGWTLRASVARHKIRSTFPGPSRKKRSTHGVAPSPSSVEPAHI